MNSPTPSASLTTIFLPFSPNFFKFCAIQPTSLLSFWIIATNDCRQKLLKLDGGPLLPVGHTPQELQTKEISKRMDGHQLYPCLFKTACIVKDLGNDTYLVPVDDAIEVPGGRQNVRLMVEDRDPRNANMCDGLSLDPYHLMARQYDDDIGRGFNFLGYSMKAIMHHMSIVP
uniref:Uncharacterized protein n=1 Tax=Lactuca sativa TaxID=4236 RepID=A0A9R1XKN3_LACSA|nr:hypothetical protein LSAT_V11C400167600 [Lactuca sativa]